MRSYAEAGVPARMGLRWSRVAQVAWLGLTLLVLLVFIFRVRALFNEAHTICVMPSCQPAEVTAAQARWLSSLGLPREAYGAYSAALFMLLDAVFFTVAGIIMWRQPRDRIAVFTGFILVLFAGLTVGSFNEPAPGLPAAVQAPVGILALAGGWALVPFLYVLPDGRLVPRWLALLIVPWELEQVSQLLAPNAPFSSNLVGVVTLIPALGAVLGAQIYRYRKVSDQSQRQQTKWVVYGFALALVGFQLTALLYNTAAMETNPILPAATAALLAAFLMIMPLGIGFAILRYRLWDIDLIINRTLVYAGLTAIVTGLYVGIVVGLEALFRAQGSIVLSLPATALVALIFQPLREWLQRGVNRLMYGERDDPYGIVSRLGRRLEVTLAPDAILPTIVETVAEALKLPYAAITLQGNGDGPVVAASGSPVGDPLRLPLVYQGNTVGQLIVSPRAGTRALNPADLRLLDGLAHQAGIAARAVQLTADLQRSRERLVIAREEERRRLRRDLHDGLGPTLAGLFQRLDVAAALVPRDPVEAVALLDDLKGQVRSTIADIRRLVYALRPPTLDEYGLVSALREHAVQYNGANGLQISFQAPEPLPPLPAAVEVAAYRITLEALTNVARHAHAHTCTVRLDVDGELCLEIADDGVGLPEPCNAGVGLTSMRERTAELGGECVVAPGPAGGTRVRVRLPISKE